LITGVFAAIVACPVAAQDTAPPNEEPANEELTYFDLRSSKDHATKQSAERYFNLVKPQEWTSLNGKSKITAKYVAHDPDLKWVKLAVVSGAGASRTTREITVQVDKLNKTCQSRVRQISVMQARLDELVVAERERRSESDAESRGGYGDEGGARSEEMTDERGGRSDPYGGYGSATAETGTTESDAGASAAAAEQSEMSDGSNEPDPLGFEELAGELAAMKTGGNPGFLGGPSSPYGSSLPGTGGREGAVDRTQWRTSYAAFHANITVGDDRGAPRVDWGELADLRQMNETAYASLRDGGDPYGSNVSEIADRIGDVQWEAPFDGLEAPVEGSQEIRFAVPPLPAPLKLRFLIFEGEADQWSALHPRPATQVRLGLHRLVKPSTSPPTFTLAARRRHRIFRQPPRSWTHFRDFLANRASFADYSGYTGRTDGSSGRGRC
jgi:hypothetical protein